MMEKDSNLALIAGNANKELAGEIAQKLGQKLVPIEISNFKDGEIYIQILESVRAKDVFLIQSTSKNVNQNLMELAIIIDALKRSSAKRITAVIPYFGYARQDRQAKAREPITAKLVANLIAAAGANRVLTMDLHSDQIEGFFDIPVDHLHAEQLIADYFLEKKIENAIVVAPDAGAAKKARKFAEKLGAGLAIIDKRRIKANEIEQMTVVGEVKGKNAIVIDDMFDTAGTICAAAKTLKKAGAKDIYVCATHGIFSEPAIERLSDDSIKEVIVTNTISQAGRNLPGKFKVLSIAGRLAKAIKAIHADETRKDLDEHQKTLI